MSQTFALRVHRALDDRRLAGALAHVSGQLRSRRAIAFESLPGAETVRDQARHATGQVLQGFLYRRFVQERFEC